MTRTIWDKVKLGFAIAKSPKIFFDLNKIRAAERRKHEKTLLEVNNGKVALGRKVQTGSEIIKNARLMQERDENLKTAEEILEKVDEYNMEKFQKELEKARNELKENEGNQVTDNEQELGGNDQEIGW